MTCHDTRTYQEDGFLSPKTIHTMDNTDDNAEYSNTQLATLLADSYKDAEGLRRDLALAKKRADKAERLLLNFQTVQQSAADVSSSSGQSPDVARMIMDYEERISIAERAKEEAESRRRAIQEHWSSLDRYLSSIEFRAQDARSHFGRIVSGDNTHISLPSVPPYAPPSVCSSTPSLIPDTHIRQHQNSSHVFPPLPPHPNPNPNRRPRTPSMESSFQQPPPKRSRGDSDDRSRRYPDPVGPPAPHHHNHDFRY